MKEVQDVMVHTDVQLEKWMVTIENADAGKLYVLIF
jgi:hypothetical protein